MRKKIAILDGYTVNPGDCSWDSLKDFGDLEIFDRTATSEIVARSKGAQILVVNKLILNFETLQLLTDLELICVSATGYNNIDIEGASKLGIAVCNVSDYGTDSVAQHIFSLILHFSNHVSLHNESVKAGAWKESPDFCYWKIGLDELVGKKLGIYGFGKIGQAVAKIGKAFGMELIVHTQNPEKYPELEHSVSLGELFELSDYISICTALGKNNYEIINKELLEKMKPSACLINTSRGGLINESDLKEALENKILRAAGLDVLSEEPPRSENLLMDVPNCVITPHIAWSSLSARNRLINSIYKNIENYYIGKPSNLIIF